MKTNQKWISFVLSLSLLFSLFLTPVTSFTVNAETTNNNYNISERIDETANYIFSKGVQSEWEAIGLSCAGKSIPSAYEEHFYNHIESQIDKASETGRVKITDIERLAMAAVALGKSPKDVNGTNLIDLIYNSPMRGKTDSMTIQGNNGPIFALIALDSKGFAEPDESKWNREKLIQELLGTQEDEGGWALSPLYGDASIDITAMAIIGLAPYKDQPKVKTAIEDAIDYLSDEQGEEGGFTESFVGGNSSEATAQTIIGLTAYGVDPTGEKFTTKKGNNLIDHLLSYHNDDGGFAHLPGTGSNAMATEQAIQALVAYDLFLKGEGRLYEFPDQEDGNPAIVDKSILKKQIEDVDNMDVSGKTDASVQKLNQKIEEVKEVLNNEEATQDTVNKKSQELADVINELEDKEQDKADKSKLNELITDANNVDTSNKTKASVESFESAIGKADWAAATSDITQEEVDEIIQELEEAISNLEEKPQVDKQVLENKINEADALDTSGKTKESVEDFESSLEEAKTMLADDNATEEDVSNALSGLEQAMSDLEDKPAVDKSELEKQVNEAEAVDLSGKSEASVEAFNDALEAANTVLTDEEATEEETAESIEKLKSAVEQLEDRKENSEEKVSSGTTDSGDKDTNTTPGPTDGSAGDANNEKQQSGTLPETATPYYNILFAGVLLLLAGAVFFFLQRRYARK